MLAPWSSQTLVILLSLPSLKFLIKRTIRVLASISLPTHRLELLTNWYGIVFLITFKIASEQSTIKTFLSSVVIVTHPWGNVMKSEQQNPSGEIQKTDCLKLYIQAKFGNLIPLVVWWRSRKEIPHQGANKIMYKIWEILRGAICWWRNMLHCIEHFNGHLILRFFCF